MLSRASIGWFLSILAPFVVGGFLARRKWRRMVARSQEIKRLIALASVETARAESEALAAYGYSAEEPLVMPWAPSPQRQLHQLCEVCYRPTTTRCKNCKVVHYCSGKCQLIHWRQGHKDECGLFSLRKKTDGLLQKDYIHSGKDSTANEVRIPAKAVTDSGGWAQDSDHVLGEKSVAKIGNSKYGKEINGSVKESVRSMLDKSSPPTNSVTSSRNDNEPCPYFICPSNNVDTIKSVPRDQSLPTIPGRSVEATGESMRSKTDSRDVSRGIKMGNSCSTSSSYSGSNIHVNPTGCGWISYAKPTKLIDKSLLPERNEASFSCEHFVQLYNWNKVELRPCGFDNCGNSCYVNSVLQCLTFTPPLTAYFLQGLHSKTCEKTDWCFTCEFEILVKKVKEGKSPLSPASLLVQMKRLGNPLGGGRQEDAHEFLRYVIDAMQHDHLKEAKCKIPSSFVEDTTLIGLTFGGYLRSKIVCIRCRGKSEQHERMLDLTVEIGGAINTLEEALQQFTRSEILDGDNKYHCSRCNSYVKAKKKLRISEAPNILTIALKRFQAGQYGKLNKVVKYPEILNLTRYMCGTSDMSVYQLYGVVVHMDNCNATFSGHYICYTKNNHGKWFKADDRTVHEVEIKEVLSARAYMLLYARCSPHFPRSIKTSTATRGSMKVKSETSKPDSHLKEPWHFSRRNCDTSDDCFYQYWQRFCANRTDLEDGVSSDNSSAVFSDAGSYSTDNSNRESISTDDSYDHIVCHWNKASLNSSDSDTSSPSSSPLFMRRSPLSDLQCYSSDARTSRSIVIKPSSKVDRKDSQPSASKQMPS